MKAQKKGNTAAVVLISILCFILTWILTTNLMGILLLRQYAVERAVPAAMSEIVLKDVTVRNADGSISTASEFIMDNYVEDDRVTLQNIENILDQGSFTDFASTKAEQYNRFLLGEGEMPVLEAEEFVALIEQNEDLIYRETGLQFLEPDKQKLRTNLDMVLSGLNPVLDRTMNKGISGFAFRSLFSVWLEVVLGILLLLVLIGMIILYARNHKSVGTGLKVYSIAGFIPCILLLIGSAFLQFTLNHTGLAVLGNISGHFTKASIAVSGIGTLVCVLLFMAGILCSAICRKAVKETIPVYDAGDFGGLSETEPVSDETEPAAIEKEQTSVPANADVLPSGTEPLKRKFCRCCGKPLINPDALFCYTCGNQQADAGTLDTKQ